MNSEEISKLRNNPDYFIKKYFMNHKFCMAHDKSTCKGEIIRSHIISKRHMRNISRNGHIYAAMGSSHNTTALFEFQQKGIDTVAHINGFCQYHDVILFKSFEQKDFTGEYRQIYDLSFRALAREYFQKKCLLSIQEKLKNGDLNPIDVTGYTKSDLFLHNINHIKKSVIDLKFLYEQMKKYKNNGLSYLLIETSKLPISTTGVIFPLLDANGNKIQKENKKQLGFIYNLISLENKSYIVISTAKTLYNNVHDKFLTSINNIDEIKKINYLLTYFFFNNDNIVINPDWYKNLPDNFKNQLSILMNFQVGSSSETNYIQHILKFSDEIIINVTGSRSTI